MNKYVFLRVGETFINAAVVVVAIAAVVDEIREPFFCDEAGFIVKELAVGNGRICGDGAFPFPWAVCVLGKPELWRRVVLDGPAWHGIGEEWKKSIAVNQLLHVSGRMDRVHRAEFRTASTFSLIVL